MGVDRQDYIVVGVDFTEKPDNYYDGDFDDLCDKYYWQEKVGNIVFIDDLYNGDYFIIGEILQSSEGYGDGLNYSLLGKEEQIKHAKMRVEGFILKHFNIKTNPYIIVRTQWS